MQVLSWFDNRTLIACDFLLATIFAVVFFGMRRGYPTLRGIGSIAISFLLGVPGTILIVSRGNIPYFLSVMVANAFVFGSFVFLYRGVLRFIGSRKSATLPSAVSLASLGILYYFSQVQDRPVPRIIALSITVGIIRGLIALELFRKSPTFPTPTTMRLFAACMALFAAVSVNCGLLTLLQGAPSTNRLQSNPIGTLTLLLGVVSICLTGLFILILLNSQLIASSRAESQKDSLSGALNRRGIEAKLTAELKHIHRSNHKLSIALIDVDYFKAINDFQGHAAGDAALRDVADTIATHLRGRDSLGRYGGDEFLLILPQTPCSIALTVAERLNDAVGLTFAGRPHPLTLSIGLTEAIVTDDAMTLIARADKALYQAKSDGRNCRRLVTAGAAIPHAATAPDGALIGDILTNIETEMLRR
jgi:diguanylate cyclase (GGDEF)-like protein